ncbi:MAG: hypothetical protein HY077_09990 [Elusimicrobia bacterium]|nr:hypothetical protein [Elusimicrobiota bacterium]
MRGTAARLGLMAALCGFSYSPAAGADFSATTSLPSTAVGHALTSSSGFLYNIGGMGGVNGILDGNKVFYAPITGRGQVGAWTEGTPLPEAAMFHSGVAWGKTLYVIGGYHLGADGFGVSNRVYYSKLNADGSPGPWNAATSLPQTTFLQSAAVENGVIYVTGGWASASETNGVYSARIQADGSLGAWAALLPLPVAVYAHVAVQDGSLYVVGGSINNGTTLTSAVYYSRINADGTLAGWQETTALPQPVAQHVAALVGGKVYVVGGWTGSAPTADMNAAATRSDGSLDAWAKAASLPHPLYLHAGTVADGVLYLSGGSDGAAPQSGVFSIPLFTPETKLLASVDLDPDTLNLVSKGKYITAYLGFPGNNASPADIAVDSIKIVRVNGKAITPIAALLKPTELEDEDGAPTLMVKFDRHAVEAVLSAGDQTLDLEGALKNGKAFSGSGKIWAISRGAAAHSEKDFGKPKDMDDGAVTLNVMTPHGGSVSHLDGKVEIPDGALRSELPITIKTHQPRAEERADPTLKAAGTGVEFGPEGTKFEQPVTVKLSYDPSAVPSGASEDDLAVHYWNPNSNSWEKLASTVDRDHHTVSAQTGHFSLYQVLVKVQPPPIAPQAIQTPAAQAPAPQAPAAAPQVLINAATVRAVREAIMRLISDGTAAPQPKPAAPAEPGARPARVVSAPSPAAAISAGTAPTALEAPLENRLAPQPRSRPAAEVPAPGRARRLLGTALCLAVLLMLWHRLVWRSMS